ncbi:MAG TPA: elongation factor G [Longimicrobiales bacterium]
MTAAREYRTEQIRNVVVLGHGGSGKTTLIDALSFVAGSSRRRGNPREGTALTMYTEEEIAHGISMQTTPAIAEWRETKLNLLDTPGYLDFTAEALAATRVADGAVLVLGATTGVEVGTEKVWEYSAARGIPRLFCISMMDREHADFDRVCADIRETFSARALPIQLPIGNGEQFRGIVDLFTGKAHLFDPNTTSGEFREADPPAELRDAAETSRIQLFESIAATNDELLERYLEDGSLPPDQALAALKLAMLSGDLFPIVCTAAEKTWGTRELLDLLVRLLPNPAEAPRELAQRPGLDQVVELSATDDGPLAALVFKTTTEPHVGELSFFRVFSGSLVSGQEVRNATRDAPEKLAHLAVPHGKERPEVQRLHAGDIGVIAKLKHTHTNDTLAAPDQPLLLQPINFPEPDISIAIRAASRSDEDKIGTALQKLHEEDPTFQSEYDAELRQTIIRGLGELHLEVQIERLRRKFGVQVTTEQPRIRYRETIRKTAEGQGKYKKQTGGHGQYGDCWIRLKPLPRGAGYRFVDSIVGGVIPSKYIPSVDKGVQEAAKRGILAGFPVVDFEAECYFGSYHSVDSSDIAFQVAGSLAFQKVAAQADPVLLEPIIEVEVTTPDEYMGDVIGDLNQRRGKILGMEPDGKKTRIRALVPEAELYRYATTLRSLTHGRAVHTRRFHGYEEVPAHVAQKVIEAARKEREEVHA